MHACVAMNAVDQPAPSLSIAAAQSDHLPHLYKTVSVTNSVYTIV